MKYIKLTQNKRAKVDNDDFGFLNQFRWYFRKSTGYAARGAWINGKTEIILMHRLINKTPDGCITDHINRDKLDNRKSNLRTVTQSQNLFNRNIQTNNTSGVTGVYWHKRNKKWRSYIKVLGKQINLGYFIEFSAAKMARELGERSYYAT